MKTYLANSMFLPYVPKEHLSNNNNCQFTIICRAKNQKKVAELLGTSFSQVRNFGGIHVAAEQFQNIPQKDNTIYYHAEHTKTGYIDKWFEYIPKN